MTLRRPHRLVVLIWVLAVAFVVIGSLAPPDSTLTRAVGRIPVSDKVVHFSAYVLLASLPVLGIRGTLAGILGACSMVLLGVLLELLQAFVPGRTPDSFDEMANILGVICGVALALPFRRAPRKA